MAELVTELFSSFSTVITSLGTGVRDAFNAIIYTGTGDAKQLSDFVKFIFVFGGVALAMGVFYKLFGLIRGVSRRG